jgi:opacity protein-like surface antigen
MVYGTGGVAFADMKYNAQVNCVGPVNGVGTLCGAPGQNIRPTGFNSTRVGWVAGAGFEYKPVSNWIFGLEYLYYRFADTDTGGPFRPERRLRSTHAPRRDRFARDSPTAI